MSEKYKIRNPEGLYFITISVIKWIDVFTRNEYKNILLESLKFCQEKKGLDIFAWCIMTSHVHLIARGSSRFSLANTIRDFKKYTSVQICRAIEKNISESRKDWMLEIFSNSAYVSKKHIKYQFWQSSYHPVELVTNEMVDQKLQYVHNNPVHASIVFSAEQYVYSSALDYQRGKKGLLNIEIIE